MSTKQNRISAPNEYDKKPGTIVSVAKNKNVSDLFNTSDVLVALAHTYVLLEEYKLTENDFFKFRAVGVLKETALRCERKLPTLAIEIRKDITSILNGSFVNTLLLIPSVYSTDTV
jgi:hypothetical protein